MESKQNKRWQSLALSEKFLKKDFTGGKNPNNPIRLLLNGSTHNGIELRVKLHSTTGN